MPDIDSPREDILQQIEIPVNDEPQDEINESIMSIQLNDKKQSIKMDDKFHSFRIDESFVGQCPITFDGAFGLTTATHGIEICPSHKSYERKLLSHLMEKHKLQKVYADRLCKAATNGLDSLTTILFAANEDIINHDHFIVCPLATDITDSIEGFPNKVKNMPCQNPSMNPKSIKLHLI
ncbi:unnamed protein product [Adineta steineri]|uniref:Uncharacterized protein n=1 Tax=Adineta steineri TaxID=433720 RepID=A0A813VCB9_9BILA|nr:unnamed protein product [Adineta steineri]CAF3971680.1 unnamed protein product [Adineta steineri]